MVDTAMNDSSEQESGDSIASTDQILPIVRRNMVASLVKPFFVFLLIAVIPYWLSGETKYLYLVPVMFVFAALATYTGRYIPISNKHDSLANRYGDIYVREVDSALRTYGMSTLLKTRWFETYADEACRKSTA